MRSVVSRSDLVWLPILRFVVDFSTCLASAWS